MIQNVASILWTKGSNIIYIYIRFWMLLIHIHGLFGSDSCSYPHHLKVSNDFWVAGVHRVHHGAPGPFSRAAPLARLAIRAAPAEGDPPGASKNH